MLRDEAAHEADVPWLFPVDLEVRHPTVDHDEGERALAEVLIGDAGAVDRSGPARLRGLLRSTGWVIVQFPRGRSATMTTVPYYSHGCVLGVGVGRAIPRRAIRLRP